MMKLKGMFKSSLSKKIRLIFIPLLLANTIAYIIDSVNFNRFNARGLVSAFTGGSTCDITTMNDIFRLDQGSFKKYLIDHFKDRDYPQG